VGLFWLNDRGFALLEDLLALCPFREDLVNRVNLWLAWLDGARTAHWGQKNPPFLGFLRGNRGSWFEAFRCRGLLL